MKIFKRIDLIKHLLTINQLKILRLLEFIDYSIIEGNKTKIFQKNNCLIIEIFSYNDVNCPFSFDFGLNENKDQFRFYLNKSAPILEVNIDSNLLDQTIEAIMELFKSTIHEELTFVNNKLVKAKYNYFTKTNEIAEIIPHVTIRKFIWFWQKKDVEFKEYKPWIE